MLVLFNHYIDIFLFSGEPESYVSWLRKCLLDFTVIHAKVENYFPYLATIQVYDLLLYGIGQ